LGYHLPFINGVLYPDLQGFLLFLAFPLIIGTGGAVVGRSVGTGSFADFLSSEADTQGGETTSTEELSPDRPTNKGSGTHADVSAGSDSDPEPHSTLQPDMATDAKSGQEQDPDPHAGVEADAVEPDSNQEPTPPSESTFPSEKGSETETTPEQEASPRPVLLSVLLVGVSLVLILPFIHDIFGSDAPLVQRAILAFFPSLVGIFFLVVPMIGGSAPSVPLVAYLSPLFLATVLPVVMAIDLFSVRRRTRWSPRIGLYLVGTVLLWFVTIPLYIYRRRGWSIS